MATIGDTARWVIGTSSAPDQVKIKAAGGEKDVPVVLLALNSMAIGSDLQAATFAAQADDQFVFAFTVETAQLLISDLMKIVPRPQP